MIAGILPVTHGASTSAKEGRFDGDEIWFYRSKRLLCAVLKDDERHLRQIELIAVVRPPNRI
jgi:hypothetical protein